MMELGFLKVCVVSGIVFSLKRNEKYEKNGGNIEKDSSEICLKNGQRITHDWIQKLAWM